MRLPPLIGTSSSLPTYSRKRSSSGWTGVGVGGWGLEFGVWGWGLGVWGLEFGVRGWVLRGVVRSRACGLEGGLQTGPKHASREYNARPTRPQCTLPPTCHGGVAQDRLRAGGGDGEVLPWGVCYRVPVMLMGVAVGVGVEEGRIRCCRKHTEAPCCCRAAPETSTHTNAQGHSTAQHSTAQHTAQGSVTNKQGRQRSVRYQSRGE